MLKSLHLKNLILIESCTIEFHAGLTVFSGETGAGKTAVIEAIGLALGERADSSVLRKGTEKASVEASFDIEGLEDVHALLRESGIDFDPEEPIIIRREIVKEGKNRAFINCQMAPLPLIQKIGGHLIDLISQHSHQGLRTSEHQREILDQFGDLSEDVRRFFESWKEERALQEKLQLLIEKDAKREREMELCRAALQELEQAGLSEGEEERLFEEHHRLAHAQELSEKIGIIHHSIRESPQSLITTLNRQRNSLNSLVSIDPALRDLLELLNEANIALVESGRLLGSYLGKLDADPKRFAFLEERLSLLNRLKRKYGATVEEVLDYKKKCKEKLDLLENLDQEIETVKQAAKDCEKTTYEQAALLTNKRKKAASVLENALTASIQNLNMPGAELSIEIKPHLRSCFGEDMVNYWLIANQGEHPVSVKESSSGGELSRLMLAIKTTLSEKNRTPTLIFDEIDANVGGETASILGDKLHSLGRCRQVICITHFPQVARQADHHFRVHKEESDGRTLTHIEPLDKREKEKELLRMLGGKKMKIATLLAICSVSCAQAADFYFVHPDRPWHFDANFRAVGKAKFKRHEFGSQFYRDADASLYYSLCLNEENSLTGQLGYFYLNFDWDKNPRFNQKHFHNALGALAWVNTSWDRWRWVVNGGATVDAQTFNFNASGVYYGVLWGRYAWTECFGLHIGYVGWWGIKNNYSLPIAGIDWRFWDKWLLKAIFPLDVSLEYIFHQHWSAAIAYGTFTPLYRFPRRVHQGGHGDNSIFEVYANGIELDLKCNYRPWFNAGIGAGWNFGGWIFIKDPHNHHGRYFKYRSAPYAQASVGFTW